MLLLCLLYYLNASVVLASYSKRAPPFIQVASDFPARLGNYTHSHENVEKPTFTCISIGECDECTPLEKKTAPYCLKYGNKEAIQCEWDDPDWVSNRKDTMTDDDVITLPSYRACPWVKRIERWRMIKFESVNLVVAIGSILVFIWRQRKLAREKYQQMAQRIGVTV